jgi:hypothetical protein
MKHSFTAVPAALAVAVALGACGSGDESGAAVSAQDARTVIERSAKIQLAPEKVPAEAREEGLESMFSNTATAAQDRQAVAVFMLEDAGVADKVRELVGGSVPESSKIIVHDNVMVVYAPAGKDRGAQVERAIEAL